MLEPSELMKYFQLKKRNFMSKLSCNVLCINPFTPDSDKPTIDKFSKITNWVKLQTG